MRVCDTKVFYDTEFEATIAAAKHDTEMRVYKCGTHYHLTHANARLRHGLGGGGKYRRCPHCKQIYSSTSTKGSRRHLNRRCLDSKINTVN